MAAYEVLLLNTTIPQIQAAQSGDTYVVPRDIAINATATITGNLGIGASSPTAKLDVLGSGDTDVRIRAGSDAALIFSETSANKNWRLKPSSGDFFFQYSATAYNSGYSALAVLTSTGNLGLGITPSAWGSNYRAFDIVQFGTRTASVYGGSGQTGIGFALGVYHNNTNWIASVSTAPVGRYEINGAGDHLFLTYNGTVTAGNAISFTQAMTLNASGNLGIGETSMGTIRLVVRKDNATAYSTSNMGAQTHSFFTNNTNGGYSNIILGCASATSGNAVYAGLAVVSEQASDTNGALAFGTRPSGGGNITERARITSGGKFGLNTTSPSGLLTVNNTTAADFTSQANLQNSSAVTINSSQAISVVTFQGASGNPDKFIAVDNFGATQYFSLGYQNGATRRNVIQFDQNDTIYFSTAGTERARFTAGGDFQVSSGGSVQVGGTAARATTAGTNRLDIFNGTAPVGTLTNGISIYSSSGEAYVMDAAGNATLFSPHDAETNEWIFKSKHTPTGKVLKIDVERLLKFVNDHFGLDAVHEFVEE